MTVKLQKWTQAQHEIKYKIPPSITEIDDIIKTLMNKNSGDHVNIFSTILAFVRIYVIEVIYKLVSICTENKKEPQEMKIEKITLHKGGDEKTRKTTDQ